jgi:hypothetical protein
VAPRRRRGQSPGTPPSWVVVRDQVGLQSQPAAFESLTTRQWRAPLNGRQPVPKTGVVASSPRGSIPPLSSLGAVV